MRSKVSRIKETISGVVAIAFMAVMLFFALIPITWPILLLLAYLMEKDMEESYTEYD